MKRLYVIVFLAAAAAVLLVCSRKKRNPYEDAGYNVLPEAACVIRPLTGDTATWFHADAGGSEDTEDDADDLTVRWGWQWRRDSTLVGDWSAVKTDSFRYGDPGLKTVAVAVRDLDGGIDTLFLDLNVEGGAGANTAPTACISVSATSGDTSTVFRFNAACCSDLEDSTGALRFSWDWNNDGTYDTVGLADTVVEHRFTVPATYTVRLQVTDSGSLSATETQLISVSAVTVPPIAAFTVSPESGYVTTAFRADASGSSDPDGDALDLEAYWDWGDGGTDAFSGTMTKDHAYGSKGAKTVTLIIRDGDDLRDTMMHTVTVLNTAPVCSATVNQAAGDTGFTFSFDVSGCRDVDDDASVLQVCWDWEGNGSWTGWSSIKTAQHAYSSPGARTVGVRVQDPDGAEDTAYVAVDVKVPLAWVPVAGGTFSMGSTDGQADETPVHPVTVSGFLMTAYEVTNQQFADFLNAYGKDTDTSGYAMVSAHAWGMRQNGSVWEPQAGHEQHPAIGVSWYGARQFCAYYGYRLPTEAEWEYACRAGDSTTYCFGNSSDTLGDYAWYTGNSDDHTHAVGGRDANAFGLYDMHGNVLEWCADWYKDTYYGESPATDPEGPAVGTYKVVRGGSWDDFPSFLRSAVRSSYVPSERNQYAGFRCVKD